MSGAENPVTRPDLVGMASLCHCTTSCHVDWPQPEYDQWVKIHILTSYFHALSCFDLLWIRLIGFRLLLVLNMAATRAFRSQLSREVLGFNLQKQ